MKSKLPKISILFLIVLILVNGLVLPQKAKASGMPVVDGAHIGTTIVQTIKDAFIWLDEKIGTSLRDIIVKRIIDMIVDQTITWIQGGGKPLFVTDWNGFVKDAASVAIDQVIKDVGLAPLCKPFKLRVNLSLLPVKRFPTRISCTLDDIVKNIEDFYNDFENGSWIAYSAAWEPQNNYFGVMLMAHDEMLQKQGEAVNAAANEAIAGKGFLSQKRCLEYEKIEVENECLEFSPFTGECTSYGGGRTEIGKCLKEEIITPGDTIGATVAKSVTSDIEWAANIQSWTSALVNAVINRLITEGVGMMGGSGTGTGSYYPPEYQDTADQQINSEKQQMVNEVKKFLNEWNYLLTDKNKSLSYVQQAKGILEQLKQIQSTSSSSACQPQVTDAEIQNLQIEIDRLTKEINDLQTKVNEANKLIAQITKADFFNIKERSSAQTAYQGFMNKYATSEQLQVIIDGSARQAADNEKREKQNELDDAQNRLQNCRLIP